MLRKVLIIVIILIVPISAYVTYKYLKKQQLPDFNIYSAIPLDAVVIIDSNDFIEKIEEVKTENKIWDEISSLETVKNFNDDLDFILKQNRSFEEIKNITESNKLIISMHEMGKSDFGFLLYIRLYNHRDEKVLLELIRNRIAKDYKFSKREYNGSDIYKINAENREIEFAFNKGVLIFGSNSILIESSIRQADVKNSVLNIPAFDIIKKTAGKNVEANIYINFEKFNDLISNIFGDKQKDIVANFEDIGDWAELDLNIKEDAVLLNGFTISNDSNNNYLNIFREQQPVDHKLNEILPSNTSIFAILGISDTRKYINSYKKYLSEAGNINQYQLFIDRYKNKFDIDLESFYESNLDEEIGVVVTDVPNDSFDENTFIVMRVKSKSITENHLEDIMGKIAKVNNRSKSYYSTEVRIDKETSYKVYALPVENLFKGFFGGIFPQRKKHYITLVDNYIVSSGSKSSLTKFIHSTVLQKTLDNDMKFERFTDYLSSKSNFYFYTNLYSSPNYISPFLNSKLEKGLKNNLKTFKKFQALAIQFQQNNGLIYNNIYLQYIPDIKDEAVTVWESHLDTSINFKPVLVTNHYTKENEIFVQDLNNKIYLINKVGRVLWKLQLNEKINSEVYQVDYYKNGKLQLLFSTKNKIHLIDRNGNYVERYPVKLRSPSTAGISVFDYDKSLDYRLFVPCQNKNVYLYGLDGNLVNGWNFQQTDTWVTKPVQHFRINTNDYIVFADKYRVYILNRRGDERISIKEQFSKSKNNIFYLETGNNVKSRFVTSDTSGLVRFIYLNGSVESKQMGNFTSNHFFEYQDMNADGYNDFIFLDNNKLEVYKKEKDKLFTYKFDSAIESAPIFFYFSYDDRKLGVVSKTSNELFLLNNNGTLYNGFPLKGSTQFSIGFLENSRSQFNLIVGSKYNFLYNYSVN